MDAKITKKRLSRFLSYDWHNIVIFAVIAILVWSLIFTMTATRIRPSQQFSVFNHYSNATLTSDFYDEYESAAKKNVFSYEVIETNTNDLASTPDDARTLLEARLTTDEGDIMFIPDIMDKTSGSEMIDGEEVYKYSCLQSFLRSYRQYVYNVDDYFNNLETYLNEFYDGGFESGTLNEDKVEAAFRARAEKNKDKRFKKEADIRKGIADDIERIKKYRDALVKMYGYIEEGLVQYTNVTLEEDEYMAELNGNFALNICPDESKLPGLKDLVYYVSQLVNADGETEIYNTAKNMNVMFFRLGGVESGFEYESLLYITDLIERCKQA